MHSFIHFIRHMLLYAILYRVVVLHNNIMMVMLLIGGGTCSTCATGKICGQASDCATGISLSLLSIIHHIIPYHTSCIIPYQMACLSIPYTKDHVPCTIYIYIYHCPFISFIPMIIMNNSIMK